jgi:hypothetical protein
MVLERWQRVGAAREPRCRCPSLQHARDVSARPSSIRPQGAGHWDAYIRSKPAPEPARRRAAWSSSAISSCRGAGRGSVAKRPLSFPTRIFFQCSWSSSMALTAQPIAARSLADGPRLPNTQAPATLFHPLAPSRPQSHTNKRVIGHCYAASLCARLLYSTCRPLGASSALFAAHGDETHRLGRPHEPDNTTANVTRAVGSHACAEVDMLCSLPKFPFPLVTICFLSDILSA